MNLFVFIAAWTFFLCRHGSIAVLINCEVLTEGFDEPEVDCILMTRPTQSTGLYTQVDANTLPTPTTRSNMHSRVAAASPIIDACYIARANSSLATTGRNKQSCAPRASVAANTTTHHERNPPRVSCTPRRCRTSPTCTPTQEGQRTPRGRP